MRSLKRRRARLTFLIVVALAAALLATSRWQDAPRQRFADRLGAPELGSDGAKRVNLYFGSRVTRGMSFEEAMRAVPPADQTRFLLISDGSVAQHLHYALARRASYDVYVVFDNGRVVDVEFAELYLGDLTPLAVEDAMRRLREAPPSER